MRVLVVEDESALQDQLVELLRHAGYAVDTAGDGVRAEFLGQTETYDAAVLDLGLPLLDGLTVLRRWRDAGVTTPVLVLTARDSWSDKVRGIDGGADDYLTKPFQVEELLARVRGLIRRASRPAGAGVAGRRGRARHAAGAGQRRGAPVRLTGARAARVHLPDAPPRPGRAAGRTGRAHLRARRRPRLEHGRGLHRAAAAQARRRHDRDRARARLPRRERRMSTAAIAARHACWPARCCGRSGCSSSPAIIATDMLFRFAGFRGSSTACSSTCRSPARWRWCAWPAASCRCGGRSPPWRGCARGLSRVHAGDDGARRRALPARGAAARRRPQHAARPPGRDGAAGLVAGRRSRPRTEDAAGGASPARPSAARPAPPRPDVLRQQVDRMRRQIDYHLAHARAAASGATPGASASVAASATALVRTLEPAPRRARSDDPRPPSTTATSCACSAKTSTRCSATCSTTPASGAGRRCGVESQTRDGSRRSLVDDDGPGVPPALRGDVLQRGVRADEAAPGSGLGPGDRRRSRRAVRRLDRHRDVTARRRPGPSRPSRSLSCCVISSTAGGCWSPRRC